MVHHFFLRTVFICTIVTGYWWYVLVWLPLADSTPLVRVHFLDVGQGDATLIVTPNGRQVLVDAGRGIHILTALDDVMPPNDTVIETAVLTHPDADHIGGFVPVFEHYTVPTIVRSFIPSSTDVYRIVMESIAHEVTTDNSHVYSIADAYQFTIDTVTFFILWPLDRTVEEKNAASVILLVKYGDMNVLLTGDAPSAVEETVLTVFPDLLTDVAIMKAGHHGSRTSPSPALLAHTTPRAIVFSYGEDNRYGHPHRAVLDRVIAYSKTSPNTRAYRTTEGTVSFCLTHTTFALC